MKIRKISSSIPGFRSVTFNDHFSVILGIAKSKGQGKSHNLGKTTLIQLIEHILFGSRDSDKIKAIKSKFGNPKFQVTLAQGAVSSVIEVDYSKKKKPVFPRERRQAYEYFIRFQDDYKNEFRKISIRGKDSTWKPLLLRLMGFDERPLIEKYEVEASIESYESFIAVATGSAFKRQGKEAEIGELRTRRQEILTAIDTLDFSTVETATSEAIAENLDADILNLKKNLFVFKKELSSINEALEHNVFVNFSEERIEDLYKELNIYFGEQIKRDINSVKTFFEQVAINRATSLNSLKNKTIERISAYEERLRDLSEKRTLYLKVIVSSSTVELYRELSTQLAQTEARLSLLTQDVYKESIQAAAVEQSALRTKQLALAAAVAAEIDENSDLFRKVQAEYSSIMKEVMDIDADVSIIKNSTGNVDFKTMSWRDGAPSEELRGEMARKISCAAFDVALRIVNNKDHGFIIHDGAIDNADKNIKKKFIDAMKQRAIQHDFQYILTAISDDLPDSVADEDIVITLSDRSTNELLMGAAF